MCGFYSDCCRDFFKVCPYQAASADRITSTLTPVEYPEGEMSCVDGYKLVAECPKNEELTTTNLKSYDKDDYEERDDFPVTSTTHNVSYINSAVFRCNHFRSPTNKLIRWSKKIVGVSLKLKQLFCLFSYLEI